MTPITSLALLRDIPLKIELPPDLAAEVKGLDRPFASIAASEEPAFVASALRTAEKCITYVDAEMHRLTEQRFSIPDPNVLKQRMIGDPRRQADQLLNALKQRVSNEKQEWTRRIAKQMTNVLTSVETQIDTLKVATRADKHEQVVAPDDNWLHDFERWKLEVFTRWSHHLAPLLQAKTIELIQPDIDALREIIGQQVSISLPLSEPMPLPRGRETAKEYSERFEVPTAGETFFEMFKGNLSTVAMIAGMVIIPVVGSLMNEAPTHVRATIMGVAVMPIIIIAAFRAKSERRKLMAISSEKARDRLKKSLYAEAKNEMDRFRPDAERYAAQYCSVALTTALGVIEPFATSTFDRREREAATSLAQAQMQVERLQDSVNLLRQLKMALSGQVVVDLRRRQNELAVAPVGLPS